MLFSVACFEILPEETVPRGGPERGTDGEGDEASSFPQPAGWAARYLPAQAAKESCRDEGFPAEKGVAAGRSLGDSVKDGQEDAEGRDVLRRSGHSYRPGSMSMDETSSNYSKKGSPSSNAASNGRSSNAKSEAAKQKQRSPFLPNQALAEDGPLHIPGIPQHDDTCPSVWPAFLAPGGSKGSKAQETTKKVPTPSPDSKSRETREARDPRDPRQARDAARDSKKLRSERSDVKPPRQRDAQEEAPGANRGRFRKPQAAHEDVNLNEAQFEAAAVSARHAAEEAAQAAKAAQLQERAAAEHEAQLKDLENQLIAAKRRNEELEAAAAIAARREEELAVQAAEMQDLAKQLSSAKQRNHELEAAAQAAHAAQAAAAKAAAQATARARVETATAAWALPEPKDAKDLQELKPGSGTLYLDVAGFTRRDARAARAS